MSTKGITLHFGGSSKHFSKPGLGLNSRSPLAMLYLHEANISSQLTKSSIKALWANTFRHRIKYFIERIRD